jgi:hypothetical protein
VLTFSLKWASSDLIMTLSRFRTNLLSVRIDMATGSDISDTLEDCRMLSYLPESNRTNPTGGRRPLPFKRDLMGLSLSLSLSLNLANTECEGIHWIHMSNDRFRWLVFMNVVFSHRIP